MSASRDIPRRIVAVSRSGFQELQGRHCRRGPLRQEFCRLERLPRLPRLGERRCLPALGDPLRRGRWLAGPPQVVLQERQGSLDRPLRRGALLANIETVRGIGQVHQLQPHAPFARRGEAVVEDR